MPEPKADKLAAVLAGESRYGIEIDSALRIIGHALPADFCLKWFSGLDDSAPSFGESVKTMIQVAEKISGEKLYDISFEATSENETIPPTDVEFKARQMASSIHRCPRRVCCVHRSNELRNAM